MRTKNTWAGLLLIVMFVAGDLQAAQSDMRHQVKEAYPPVGFDARPFYTDRSFADWADEVNSARSKPGDDKLFRGAQIEARFEGHTFADHDGRRMAGGVVKIQAPDDDGFGNWNMAKTAEAHDSDFHISPSFALAVPEPDGAVLMAVGLAVIAFASMRRRKKQ